MSSPSTEPPDNSADRFTEQARQAGLTLPRVRRTKLRDVAAIVAVILIVSVGVGVATGWMNFRPASSGPPGLFGSQSCSISGGQKIHLDGSTSEGADPLLSASLTELSSQFTGAYGSCVAIGYPAGDSGEGLSAIASGGADFAVLESAPSSEALAALPAPTYVLPIGLSSVSVIYNLPGSAGTLGLNASVLAGVYSGLVTEWDAPAILALNPGLNLPSLKISVVYRSDATPLNAEFSSYLAAASASWNASTGVGSSPAWPTGVGEPSSGGLLTEVANVSGAIGYIETGLSTPAGVVAAALENPAGSFVGPDPTSVASSATSLANRTFAAGANWTGASLLNAPGVSSYPLAFLSYLVLYQDLGRALSGNLSLIGAQWEMTFLWWTLTDGGYVTAPLGFVELPGAVVTAAQLVLEKVAFDGKSVLEDTEGPESGGETGEF